jgi:two-component system phosphate regulon sensor histidine kinase PhoR
VFDKVEPGRHVSAVIRAPIVLDTITQTAASGGSATVDYEQRVPIERRFEVHVASIAAWKDGDGENGRPVMAVLLRDLTQQERVERMRADFVANASHELRTPLASVLGFIETLQGAARNDERAREEFLELMRSQAARMARLIDDLLSLNRIELNAHLRPSDEVDLSQVVGHVVDVLAPLAREIDVELAVSVPDGPLKVRGDRDELVQVVQNLVENALKYGESGKRVDLVCEPRDGGGVRLTVRDYGPGIAPEHVPRLTERFYRVDVTDSRQKGGTGLGLAIVKHILNRHRAKLAIRSRLGEGASFIVDLPGANERP